MKFLSLLLVLACAGHSVLCMNTNLEVDEQNSTIGMTRSGALCRKVVESDDGFNDEPKKSRHVVDLFLLRQNGTAHINTASKLGPIYYDCFFDVDTQEFQLTGNELIEESNGFVEKFVFQQRMPNGSCDIVRYSEYCRYNTNKTEMFCTACGGCIEVISLGFIFAVLCALLILPFVCIAMLVVFVIIITRN